MLTFIVVTLFHQHRGMFKGKNIPEGSQVQTTYLEHKEDAEEQEHQDGEEHQAGGHVGVKQHTLS